MATKYLLPCDCGESTPVETSQAGGEVVCVCGKTLAVPRLLQLKKLPTATEETTSRPAASPGGAMAQRILVLGGWAWALLFLAAAGYSAMNPPTLMDAMSQRVQFSFGSHKVLQNTTPISQMEMSIYLMDEQDMNRLSTPQAWSLWQVLRAGPEPSISLQTRLGGLQRTHGYWIATLIGFAAVGAITAISAMLSTVGARPSTRDQE